MHASRSAGLVLLMLGIACSASRQTLASIRARTRAPEFTAAVELAARRHAEEVPVVAAGGHSILLDHGRRTPRVFLLLHGFTDAPTQFASVGQRLFDSGDNVYIPRLPHHAERESPVRALGQMRVWDMTRFGNDVIRIARGLGDSVIVVGLSAGGTIAATLAKDNASVRRAVLISPALGAGPMGPKVSAAITIAGLLLPNVERSETSDTTRPEYTQGLTSRGLAHVLLLGASIFSDSLNDREPRSPDITVLLNERDLVVRERAAMDLAQRWFDRGRRVVVYRFPVNEGLPHNVMAPAKDGGRPELVLPVVESLARGETPQRGVRRLAVPCRGLGCRARQMIE